MHWRRKGEWLELEVADTLESVEQAAKQAAAIIGEKWSRTLLRQEGLQWKGRRLLLKLFPDEPADTVCELDAEAGGRGDVAILYEDDFALVVSKPAGMKVHPTEAGERGTLLQAVDYLLASDGQRVRARHIHRLDEDTTGPVLFAKHAWVQTVLDAAMREKAIGRTYIAVVQGRLAKAAGRIDAPIGRDRHHPTRRRVSPRGEHAVTRFERLETYRDASLVRLRLETGRTHQIRVHLSDAGHPLYGDLLYGGKPDAIGRQALHGEHLAFPHPLTSELIEVEAPWPDDFHALLQRLKK